MKAIQAILVAISIAVTIAYCTSTAHASIASEQSCRQIEGIFARGSGQGKATDVENNKFESAVQEILKDKGVTYHQYNLGTEKYGGSQYPHVDLTPSTVIGAYFSAGAGFRYGKSVDTGVLELSSYLKERMTKCKNATFILAGYSQGAQVIGDAMPGLSQNMRDRISYIAFFGDPKLNLPESEQWTLANKYREDTDTDTYLACRDKGSHCLGDHPDACYGANLSPWRHTVDNCDITARGVLGPRTPYVSDDLKDKTHLWCIDRDIICGSNRNIAGDNSGHMSHYVEDRAIPTAAKEAIASVAKNNLALSAQLIDDLDIQKNTLLSQANYDVAMLSHDYCAAGDLPGEVDIYRKIYADGAKQNNIFVGSVLFSTPDEAQPSTAFLGTPESAVSLIGTMWYTENWRPNANKVIYVFSKPHCKIKIDFPEWLVNYTTAEIGYSNTFPRISLASSTTSAIPSTAIVYITTPEDYPTALANTRQYENFFIVPYSHQLQNIEDIPTSTNIILKSIYSPQFTSSNYAAFVNQPITFSLKNPLPAGTNYSWDFNDDGITDQHTSLPTTTHTYASGYAGLVHVRARDTDGAQGTASAKMIATQIDTSVSPLEVARPTAVSIAKLSESSARVEWTSSDTGVDSWFIRVNGFPVGRVEQSGRTVVITDLEFDHPVTISVSGLASNGAEGEWASATIEPNNSTDTPALRRTGDGVYTLITKQGKVRLRSTYSQEVEINSNPTPSPTTRKSNSKPSQLDGKNPAAHSLVAGGILIALGAIIAGFTVFTLLHKK